MKVNIMMIIKVYYDCKEPNRLSCQKHFKCFGFFFKCSLSCGEGRELPLRHRTRPQRVQFSSSSSCKDSHMHLGVIFVSLVLFFLLFCLTAGSAAWAVMLLRHPVPWVLSLCEVGNMMWHLKNHDAILSVLFLFYNRNFQLSSCFQNFRSQATFTLHENSPAFQGLIATLQLVLHLLAKW